MSNNTKKTTRPQFPENTPSKKQGKISGKKRSNNTKP